MENKETEVATAMFRVYTSCCKLSCFPLSKRSIFFPKCVKAILKPCENLCEQMHIKEGGIVVNSLGKLLEKACCHFGSILPLNNVGNSNVCVLSTRGFCCLSDDWRAAKTGPAHSSPSQAQVMFFCLFLPANNRASVYLLL